MASKCAKKADKAYTAKEIANLQLDFSFFRLTASVSEPLTGFSSAAYLRQRDILIYRTNKSNEK